MYDIILFAMREEAPTFFTKYRNIYCIGTGKVNSAINTMNIIANYDLMHNHLPKRIINLGTAGSINLNPGIYRVNKVVQHDVNLTAVGLEPGYHFHEPTREISLRGEGVTCGSGDVFVTESHKLRVPCDLVEMEAYSVARACAKYNVECEIWKYISDKADENANTVWQDRIAAGESLYMKVLQDLGVKLEEKFRA